MVRKKKVGRTAGAEKTRRRNMIIFSLILIAAGMAAAYGVFMLTAVLPPAGPASIRVIFYDVYTGDEIKNVSFDVFYYTNDTAYKTNLTSGEVYEFTDTDKTYGIFANISGYYPVSGVLSLEAGVLKNNSFTAVPIPDKSDVNISIIYKDGSYGSFNSTDFSGINGTAEFKLYFSAAEDNLILGVQSYVPKYKLNNTTYSYQNNITRTDLWMAFNCTVTYASVDGAEVDIYDSVEINGTEYSVFRIFPTFGSGTKDITVNMETTGDIGMLVYDYLIDNPVNTYEL